MCHTMWFLINILLFLVTTAHFIRSLGGKVELGRLVGMRKGGRDLRNAVRMEGGIKEGGREGLRMEGGRD